MRVSLVLLAIFLLGIPTPGQKSKKPVEQPTQFEVGNLMFFDFGPPFQYYNLYVVRPVEGGTEIARLIFSRPGDKCFTPAKLESSASVVRQPVAELLGAKNPCEIPQKKLKKEAQRCKHCLVFSGSDVIMRVECGNRTRLIRSDILDRDMFDPGANTPENTAWTMRLLQGLDKAVGPGVMEKPVFQVKTEEPVQQVPSGQREADLLRQVDAGEFDTLFPIGPNSERLSVMSKEVHDFKAMRPSVRLTMSSPVAPVNFVEPAYPPLALATRAEGEVTVAFEVLSDGTTRNARILSGYKLLNQAALDTVARWKFPTSAAADNAQATIAFTVNCPK